MHGRVKKDVVEPTPEEKEKQKQQVKKARELFGKLLELRQAKTYNAQTLEMTTTALGFHPEFPTMWGYRREILQSGIVDDNRKQTLEAEMKLLQKALFKSTKVYSIWFHRRWVVEQLFQACTSAAEARRVLDVELELCGRLLEVDERNFHCWNHRAFVMGMMLEHERQQRQEDPIAAADTASAGKGADAVPEPARDSETEATASLDDVRLEVDKAKEPSSASNAVADAGDSECKEAKTVAEIVDLAALDLKLSAELINRNFSNYSAWHLRALLQQAQPSAATGAEANLNIQIDTAKELEWVQQGIYTEPNDQSIWLYHHWLTLLGRGCARLRLTHTAILGGELFVFFSGSACARNEDGSSEPAAVVSIQGDDAVPILKKMPGALVPVGAGGLSHTRTRQLPTSRRRWTAAWKFVPHAGADFASSIASAEPKEVHIEASIEVQGTHATGAAARGWRRLTFRGAPVLCNRDSSAGRQSTHPALAAFSTPEGDPARVEILEGELARVEELLEIEPDCKWALLSRSRLASACAAGSGASGLKSAEESCIKGYDQICALDPLRRGFYSDARADCLSRIGVLSWLASDSGMHAPLNLGGLAIRSLVTSTMLAAFGVRIINVEENKLRTLGPLLLLVSLEELYASRNQLVGSVTEAFCLPRLRCVDVSHNNLELRDRGEVPPPEHLQKVDVSHNPAVLAQAGAAKESSSVEKSLIRSFAGIEQSPEWSLDLSVETGRCVFCSKATEPSEEKTDA